MKKNDEFELLITDMSDEGAGIGKKDGFIWFVKDAVIGDRVLAGATKVKKNYGFARVIRILEPSKDRVEAPCAIARQCGGCQLQALSYEAQLRFKERKAANNLRRIGGFSVCEKMEPIIGMEEPFRYRNKAQFPIGRNKEGKIVAGFYAGRTHSIIACEDCLLGAPENRQILDCIIRHMEQYGIEPYDERSLKGVLRHVLIRKGYYTGELMVCLVINADKYPHIDTLVEMLKKLRFDTVSDKTSDIVSSKNEFNSKQAEKEALFYQNAEETENGQTKMPTKESASKAHIASVSYCINKENTNVIMGEKLVNVYGPGYIEDEIRLLDGSGIRFRISPHSFYQVNPRQMERLYATALEFADLKGEETVWDLYCGIGTISLFLAQKAKKVYGVEIIPQAIENARDNAKRNGIGHAEFFVGKAEEVLPRWYEEQQHTKTATCCKPQITVDVIVVDPPRKGCDPACLETMVKIAPKRIVYVSCDSATLARDLKYLCANGYELKRVRACDMFGQTVHVETVCLLTQKGN